MALRDQLLAGAAGTRCLKDWRSATAHAIADVAPGVHTPESAAFLLKHIGKYRSRARSSSTPSITSPATALRKR